MDWSLRLAKPGAASDHPGRAFSWEGLRLLHARLRALACEDGA